MLSVKHIHPNGTEEIMPAKYVRYEPAPGYNGPPEPQPSAPTVWICAPDGHESGCHWGSFFIMNETGKTVARYDLGGELAGAYASGSSSRPAGSPPARI